MNLIPMPLCFCNYMKNYIKDNIRVIGNFNKGKFFLFNNIMIKKKKKTRKRKKKKKRKKRENYLFQKKGMVIMLMNLKN